MNKQNIPQPDLEAIERELKRNRVLLSEKIFHSPTSSHSNKSRGVGITRKNKEETKKSKKSAKLQRATNRKISNKKFRPSGSKKRK